MENTEAMDVTMQTEQKEAPVEETEAEAASQAEAEVTETEEQEQTDQGIKVRFNHQDRELTREEAITYAQKGLKYDNIAPMLDELSYLAAINGKTASELVKEYINQGEAMYRRGLEEKYGDDTEVIEMMMERYRTENKAKYEKAESQRKIAEEAAEKQARETLEGRLADAFVRLQKEFPELQNFAELPKEVKQAAADGKDLVTAYLLHQHREERKTSAAKQAEAAANKASAGKMDPAGENDDPLMSAFLKGLKS